jgi:Asp-tRNA(Asn)/Glu-tRNA(Gln) amidotransferase C subunit
MKKYQITTEQLEKIKEHINQLNEMDLDPKAGSVVLPKNTNPNEIKKMTSQGIDVQLKEEKPKKKLKK